MNLPDVQSTEPVFKIPINKVGIRNIKIPFTISKKDGGTFSTIATISSYCDLVDSLKGINMSRISRSINEIMRGNKLGFTNLVDFAKKLQEAHKTNHIYVKARFTLLLEDLSPVTKTFSYEPVDVIFETNLIDGKIFNYLTVKTTEMSLCPCSKEMSLLINNVSQKEMQEINTLSNFLQKKILMAGFGAHNQKSIIEVKVELNTGYLEESKIMWIEDILDFIKQSSSCATFSTLKRPDEKYITEVSYLGGYFEDENKFIKVEGSGPKFVEDISRSVANKLDKELDKRILDYVIVVNNEESIHSDDIVATAVLSAGRNLK